MTMMTGHDERHGARAAGSAGRGGCPRATGFSLLEVVIALALTLLLLGGVYGFYVSTMRARDSAVHNMRETLLMRALLEQIADEIRQITDVVPDSMGFTGSEEELTFIKLVTPDMGSAYAKRDPFADPKPGLHDFMRVTYKLQWDEDQQVMDEDGTPICYGLLRSFQSPIDPNPSFNMSPEELAKYEEDTGFKLEEKPADAATATPPVSAELIAPEIKYLRFKYFDGAEWRDRWRTDAPAADAAADSDGSTGESAGDGGSLSGGDASGKTGSAGRSGGEGSGLISGARRSALNADGKSGAGSGKSGDLLGGGTGAKPGGSLLGGGGQEQKQGYILPQAIRITIGRVKVPRDTDGFDPSKLAQEEELDKKTYHPDRWTITVYLQQADQSQLSSRKYGVDNNAQMGEQTEGGSK
jgi:uncharacterized membrane protein YgcG